MNQTLKYHLFLFPVFLSYGNKYIVEIYNLVVVEKIIIVETLIIKLVKQVQKTSTKYRFIYS